MQLVPGHLFHGAGNEVDQTPEWSGRIGGLASNGYKQEYRLCLLRPVPFPEQRQLCHTLPFHILKLNVITVDTSIAPRTWKRQLQMTKVWSQGALNN